MISQRPHFDKSVATSSPVNVASSHRPESEPIGPTLRLDIVDPAEDPATTQSDLQAEVAEAYSFYLRAIADYSRHEDLLLFHQREADRLEKVTCNSSDRKKSTRASLIKSIVRANPRPYPTVSEWYHSPKPHWSVMIDGTYLGLIKSLDEDAPDSLEDPTFSEVMMVVAIDLVPEQAPSLTIDAETGLVRSMVIRSIARLEESRETLRSLREKKACAEVEELARMDAQLAEESLAYLISASYNRLAPFDLQVEEESEESVGIGFRHDGKVYMLLDFVGNMRPGIIGDRETDKIIDL